MRRIGRFIQRVDKSVSCRILNRMDAVKDRRICGESLVKYVPSIYRDDRNGIGGTGTESSHYAALKRIFSNVQLSPSDVFLDVGCGKGRVLAFLISEKCPCPLNGIEHNEAVGRIAAGWSERYDQVHVFIGDALAFDYDPYTVLMLARPFLPKTFLVFLDQLEKTLSHPVTLIYWWEQESGYLLNRRPGWNLLTRGKISRIHGLRIASCPQWYSVWRYDPSKRVESSIIAGQKSPE